MQYVPELEALTLVPLAAWKRELSTEENRRRWNEVDTVPVRRADRVLHAFLFTQTQRQDRVLGLDLGVRQDAEEGGETALWIAVDHQDLVATNAQALSKRHCGRSLGDAALEIGDRDCDCLGAWRTHPSGAKLPRPGPHIWQAEFTTSARGVQPASGQGAALLGAIVDLASVQVDQAAELCRGEVRRLLLRIRS